MAQSEKRDLDVLIINPSALGNIYQSLSSNLAAIEPPIWAALIANNMRSKNISVDILDCEGLGLTAAGAASKISDYNPKLIAVVVYGQQPSASTQNMFAAHVLCETLKEQCPEYKVLLVGGHVSALPERTLAEEKVDFVCKGEGIYTIQGLLEIGVDNASKYNTVPGLYYRENGETRKNAPAAVVPQKLMAQELPGMAFDLLPMENYRAHNWHCFDHINERQPYASVYTSLGCPFRCTFCCINAPFGKSSFRYWEPEFMIGQFDELAEKYNVKNIKIADEMFVMNEKHYLRLCELLKERGHGFNIWAYARVDTVKEKHLEALKAAGVNWLALGIESGNTDVRLDVTKGRFQMDDIHTIVRKIKEAGINVIGNYIFGLPEDTVESMRQTYDLAEELNCEMSNFYSAMAYPGSKLFHMAETEGWELPDSWLGYSQHAFETLPLRTKHISASEVLTFRDQAFQQYFNNPKYLNLVKDRFGQDTHDHIVAMTKHKLDRKHKVETNYFQ